ncbi:hypothetical protein FRC16_009364 [Serendipita sp. 398]|nr:hypothetical protein FRC16_009364 [Serendipita sp. 398]
MVPCTRSNLVDTPPIQTQNVSFSSFPPLLILLVRLSRSVCRHLHPRMQENVAKATHTDAILLVSSGQGRRGKLDQNAKSSKRATHVRNNAKLQTSALDLSPSPLLLLLSNYGFWLALDTARSTDPFLTIQKQQK